MIRFSKSSLLEVICNKGSLREFAKLTRKQLIAFEIFYNKVASFWPATLLKKALQRRYFHEKIWDLFKQNTFLNRTPPLAASVFPNSLLPTRD